MKKTGAFLLIALLLAAPLAGLAASTINLDGLSLRELETLRQEADARIRLLLLQDAEGYVDVRDGEEIARNPEAYRSERVKLKGDILRVEESEKGFRYYISLSENPGRVFLVNYALGDGQRLLLAGDEVMAYGVFIGLTAFDGEDPLVSGAPVITASLVTTSLPEIHPLAADPYAATREDPAPLGASAVYEGSYWSGYATFEMEMVSALRGQAALSRAQEMTKYNVAPLKTQEYLLVWVRVKALAAPGGKAEISEGDFSFVSANGSEYLPHYLLNSTESLRNLFEGGEQTALIACIVDKGDRPLIVYQPKSEIPLWFDPNRRHTLDLSGRQFSPVPLNGTSADVPRIKALLAEMGFLKKLDSGNKFTSAVRSALMEYQKAMGLKATGEADEATQRLLLSGAYPPGFDR
ncbi:MAG: peptidoglycan-binding domain-containing protein [Eubacteriales bacterium]|nr:peptidoglycan-binding domain-containing protein [Eubacteriales bacterium]